MHVMNFQTSKKKTGICSSIAITSLVYYMPDTIFPSCQQLAIIGFCEFCSIPLQEKQKKPLLDNKLSTSWPLLSPHLWQSPLRSTNWRLKAWFERLEKKTAGLRRVTTLQRSAHICWVNDFWKKNTSNSNSSTKLMGWKIWIYEDEQGWRRNPMKVLSITRNLQHALMHFCLPSQWPDIFVSRSSSTFPWKQRNVQQWKLVGREIVQPRYRRGQMPIAWWSLMVPVPAVNWQSWLVIKLWEDVYILFEQGWFAFARLPPTSTPRPISTFDWPYSLISLRKMLFLINIPTTIH